MKKLFIILCVFCNTILPALAQNVQFSSSNIEVGIRQHLGIDETDNITIEQIDTITNLNLSSLFIRDIRDLSLLSNVKYLNLSNNLIDNVAPLVTLDSLRFLNLNNNNLESISMLSFSYAKEMYVNVAFNYIKDFSCFKTLTHCDFTIDGAGFQDKKDAPYFKVYHLYCEVDASNVPKVFYRGYTNMEADVTLQYASNITPATLDGVLNTIEIPEVPLIPIKVILSNGVVGDTTYVVPTADYTVEAGKSVTLETGLPDDYHLSSAYAMLGTVEIDCNSLLYTAPEKLLPDTVYISYYQGTTLRGFSRFYINKDAIETVPIKIGSNGKTTYTGDKDLDFSFSDEVKAFIATGFDKNEGIIWMTRVKDVPARVPVMIKGTANETYNVPVSESGTSYYKNMFVGNISGETISIGKTSEDGKYDNYYLSKGQFVSVNGSANIGNNKCYLQLPAEFKAETTGEGIKVKIADSGKSSFAAPYDLDFTDLGDDLKAFTATGYDASTTTVWLTRVKKVQKGEGLMLKGKGGETYTIPSTGIQATYENMIMGNISGATVEIGETSDDGTLTNFYLKGGTYMKVVGSANIGNNKSYLQLPTYMLAGARSEDAVNASDLQTTYDIVELETESMPIIFGSIGDDDDETTGIRATDYTDEGSTEWYDLQGRRISQPTKKGLYIHDGKKIVIK